MILPYLASRPILRKYYDIRNAFAQVDRKYLESVMIMANFSNRRKSSSTFLTTGNYWKVFFFKFGREIATGIFIQQQFFSYHHLSGPSEKMVQDILFTLLRMSILFTFMWNYNWHTANFKNSNFSSFKLSTIILSITENSLPNLIMHSSNLGKYGFIRIPFWNSFKIFLLNNGIKKCSNVPT